MGHRVNAQGEYRLLQRQLDRSLAGAPHSPVLMEILRLLFSAEEAALARRLPGRPTSLDDLATRLGIARAELGDKLSGMAQRGLVFDFEHDGERYFALAPVVIGFFEFTFMRVRDDVPMAELARLFDQYMHHDDRFARSVFRGPTQISRALAREEALPQTDHTEVLDWERASRVVQTASAIAVSLCACRHLASHLGEGCDRPQSVCLSLNWAADSVVRNGFARKISAGEAMRILEDCKRAGLAQFGDNVRRKVAYICNCCGCCCEMVRAMKTCNTRSTIVSSNWIMEADLSRCEGCGQCAAACPVDAVKIVREGSDGPQRKWAVLDETLCVGCGVCYGACRLGAISMKPRAKRVVAPETVFDRLVLMAIERGKLTDLIFEDPQRLSHRALSRIVAVLERSPFFQAAMAIRPLRSVFLNRVVAQAKKRTGKIGEVFQ